MILFLTNADTEILALRCVAEGLPAGFPPVRAANPCLTGAGAGTPAGDLNGVTTVIVRLLGGRRSWEEGFESLRRRCREEGIAFLAFGGEVTPDAEMAGLSSVPSATWAQAFEYLVQGGLANLEHMLRFVIDTVGMEGFGFDPAVQVPSCGLLQGWPVPAGVGPVIGVVFYRAHFISGNTGFVENLCQALAERGAHPVPVYCYSLRNEAAEPNAAIDLLRRHQVDAVITTVLASGLAGTNEDGWDASALAELGVPVIQAMAATSSRAEWEARSVGLAPVDVAMSVAIPEFDGRIVSVPFSFKEIVDDGDDLGSVVAAYRSVPDRVARVAGIAIRLARLRYVPPRQRRIALVLSAYPTKASRLGNAVGLDTPASVVELLHALVQAGYQVDRIPPDGDALMAELADTLTYDRDRLSPAQIDSALGRWSGEEYRDWFCTLPDTVRSRLIDQWGEAPGQVHTDGDDLVFSGIDLGGVVIAIQPPRGFGEDPIAVYHSPDLAPTHHYLGFYRWLDVGWGADAIVHVGKHGTLEWLPGKGVGLSAECFPDLALGEVPLIYPFVVNDPGEGTQAKRRGHAVIIDHLVPPMTRAETYDDLARLEGLLDTHARVATLDPAKLPAIRKQVWELLVSAEIHRDMGVDEDKDDKDFANDEFDELLLHVDGYLCELKDASIRGGLHTLGQAPAGDALIDMVLAMTRLDQGSVRSLRACVAIDLGLDLDQSGRSDIDAIEAACRSHVVALADKGWTTPVTGGAPPGGLPQAAAPSAAIGTLTWVAERLVPALEGTRAEITSILAALDGKYVSSGPSGAPTRGMAHVLPTGRNFYSVDPKAIPSPLAWDVGRSLAEAVLERHRSEEGRYPESVGLVVWGTSAMRTAGDDVAQALAFLGVRPTWADESGRVTGLEVIPLAELGRPRIDVTLRISGFFRDAFPHVVDFLDEAVAMVAGLDEDGDVNYVRAHGGEDPRIFGPKPGAYGSGILGLLESRDWRSDDDLAQVYMAWGGFSYRRGGVGRADPEAMARRFGAIEVAVKNQDNREHDIFDSDDYLQDHGGMVATVRALTGRDPKAFFGDSADPSRPRVRSLAEEAARVIRTRVVNPKWIGAMMRHGYKGAFEMSATVDYIFGYDATTHVVQDWMYEKVTQAYVADAQVRKFFEQSNPWALRAIAERLLEADQRGLWNASDEALAALRSAILESEGWEEGR